MIERKAVQLNLPTSAEVNDSENGLPVFGNKTNPDVIVICDAPKVWEFNKRTPIGKNELELFGRYVGKSGFGESEFLFISPCGPVPKEYENSEKKKAEHLALYREQFLRLLDTYSPKVIICFGNMALRQLYGKAVMVSKARGRIDTSLPRAPVMAMNSPANVLRVPELTELFEADIRTLKRFQDTGYDANAMLPPEKDYAWGRADELRELLTSGKVTITIDSETTGLMWHRPEVYPLTVQITRREGEGRIYPVHYSYCAKHNMPYTQDEVREITRLIVQVINSPDIRMVGHNLKYDHQMFMKLEGANPKGWLHDTQLMAFMADENMRSKDLAECTRRWAPAMSGYSDIFDSTVDKSKMIDVTPDKMIDYACGDTDATMRVYKTLQGILKEDKQHANRYTRVVMPAILTFATSVERHGIPIDSSRLGELSTELSNSTNELYTKMIAAVPPAVRRKHLDKGLEFSRADFMRDILFSPEGFNLTPIVFTGTTEALPPEQRIPSTSVKDHLPYFNDNEFVQDYMTYTKLQKLRTTYVDGFLDKYATNSVIHPSYMLHRTNTGRSASANPNGQNFPKRGKLAKTYRSIFKAREGFTFLECDLSQAELRLAAWESGDPVMLNTYRNGGDIHRMTAATTMKMGMEQFNALEKDVIDFKRFCAKAVNFGYVYGMGWRGFKVYAKTNYGVDYTDEEAMESRELYFQKYHYLVEWHERRRREAHCYGSVRSLHGAIRHLPSIYSNDKSIVSMAERQAINAPVQQFASDIGIMAMYRIARDCDHRIIRPIGFIHDAILLEVRSDMARELAANVKFYMQSLPLDKWFGINPPLPIVADASIGVTLSSMNELKDVEAMQPEWYRPENDDKNYWEFF